MMMLINIVEEQIIQKTEEFLKIRKASYSDSQQNNQNLSIQKINVLSLIKDINMETEEQWPILKNANHIVYTPQPLCSPHQWLHQFLFYPKCPLIGRYNKGQYRIGETLIDFDFKCTFNHQISKYQCGTTTLHIPEFMVNRLRNIPEIIPDNRPKNMKKRPEDVHQETHRVQEHISFNWIISFGEMGRDFLNYLNHTYLFTQEIFNGPKLLHTTFNIPIIVHMPQNSGLKEKQVERGICMEHYRSEYLSIHLKGGAPAFSPNNMRLGIQGMKEVKSGQSKKSNQNKEGNKKKNKKQRKKSQKEQIDEQPIAKEKDNGNENEQIIEPDLLFNDDLFEDNQKPQIEEQMQKAELDPQKIENLDPTMKKEHQKFIQFYTSILLPDDHRVYYHWHIEDEQKQPVIRQLLQNTKTIKDFIKRYRQFIGDDALISEALKLGLGG